MFSSHLEVTNKEIMQNNYRHDDQTITPSSTTTTTTTIDRNQSTSENFSLPNIMNRSNVDKMEEKQHDKCDDDDDGDEKHIEIEAQNNNKPLIQVETSNDSPSSFPFHEEFYRCELLQQSHTPSQPQHTDSHDSLLQPDHHNMNNINTAASSTDDLSTTHQLSSSVFHSKDSALGLSDDNLHYVQTNPALIKDDDDDDEDDLRQEDRSKYLISFSINRINSHFSFKIKSFERIITNVQHFAVKY